MRRNSPASSSDTSFLPQPSYFSERPFTGISSSGAGITLSFCSATFAFLLAFAGCVGRSGGANTRLLRVTSLSPVILVTLADNELMSMASSFLSLGGAYLHGTAWLFWYGNRIGLITEGYQGIWGAASLVKYITTGLGLPKPPLVLGYRGIWGAASLLLFTPLIADFQPALVYHLLQQVLHCKHVFMLCSAPGCIKQESFPCPPGELCPPFVGPQINLLGVVKSFKGLDLRGLPDSTALTAPPP